MPHWVIPSAPSDFTSTIAGNRHYRGTTTTTLYECVPTTMVIRNAFSLRVDAAREEKNQPLSFSLSHSIMTDTSTPTRYILLVVEKVTSHHITSHHITSHHITSHHITSHHITLHYITLHYITLHYITLHYITLPGTLHYITLHYIEHGHDAMMR